MKSLEICKSNLYKTKGLNNILLLDSPLGLDIIADSGLMNKSNVALLRQAGYKYILGVRIRSERVPIKQGIFSLERKDKSCCEYKRNGEWLIWKDTLPIQILTLNVLSLNITDYGCGTCFQNFKRDIGNVPHVSLYRKKDWGTCMHLLHRLQNIQGIGETCWL